MSCTSRVSALAAWHCLQTGPSVSNAQHASHLCDGAMDAVIWRRDGTGRRPMHPPAASRCQLSVAKSGAYDDGLPDFMVPDPAVAGVPAAVESSSGNVVVPVRAHDAMCRQSQHRVTCSAADDGRRCGGDAQCRDWKATPCSSSKHMAYRQSKQKSIISVIRNEKCRADASMQTAMLMLPAAPASGHWSCAASSLSHHVSRGRADSGGARHRHRHLGADGGA